MTQFMESHPWLGATGFLCLVALILFWAVAASRADRRSRQAQKERRAWAKTRYEDAKRQMKQFAEAGTCGSHMRFALEETVRAWQNFHSVDPEHCPLEPESLDIGLEAAQEYGKIPS